MSSNGQHHHRLDCEACDLPTQERLNYFTGQFLTERDFRDEQGYFLGKHRQHNRYLHGWGTVCGLKVVQHPNEACRDRFVVIEPGMALDCCGREIVLKDKFFLDLVKELEELGGKYDELANQPDKQHKQLLISLCAAECETEFVPALYTECGCDETRCEANRIHEGFDVDVQIVDEGEIDRLTGINRADPVEARLSWDATVNLKDAYRVALDAERKRLYVLTKANPGQIMIYQVDNQCCLGSINIDGEGIDLAIASDGGSLYVIRQVKNAETDPQNYLRIVDALDSTVHPIDVRLSPGNKETSHIKVAPKSGQVFLLDRNEPSVPQVKVWNQKPANDPNLVHQVSESASIAVTSDGQWLFATSGDQINIFKVTNNNITPTPSPISLSEESPQLIAVSDDGSRLFVVTDINRVHAFEKKDDGSKTFEEIKPSDGAGGVKLTEATPVALEVSPSGKWAYVLSEDGQGKGQIHVVNGGRLRTNPKKAVSDPVAVMANPSDLLLSPDGRRLFVAAEGGQDPACGGVSLLDVKETQCEDILWHTLNGCPECTDYSCVPLAAIQISDWINPDPDKKWQRITNSEIDNEIRPLVPSTNTLKQLILCALEKASGQQGPEGPRGPKGKEGSPGTRWLHGEVPPSSNKGIKGDYYLQTKGDQSRGDVYQKSTDTVWDQITNLKGPQGNDGAPGEGLEPGLTQIHEISWNHNDNSKTIRIEGIPTENFERDDLKNHVIETNNKKGYAINLNSIPVGKHETLYGIIVQFTKEVRTLKLNLSAQVPDNLIGQVIRDEGAIAARHIFQAFSETRTMPNIWNCRCSIKGLMLPVISDPDESDKWVFGWKYIREVNNAIIEDPRNPDEDIKPSGLDNQCIYLFSSAVAFIFSKEFIKSEVNSEANKAVELWIRLQGDFVIDANGRAIDAEFVRAETPTGDRGKGSNYGIQGGIFESWCWLGRRPVETCYPNRH